jgi:hypothetical protein
MIIIMIVDVQTLRPRETQPIASFVVTTPILVLVLVLVLDGSARSSPCTTGNMFILHGVAWSAACCVASAVPVR